MAIKFKNRILFIKDTASNEEICCWYFHGNGKKLGEVCCTSIVYTTEKKQTKV
jgi:BTB/POZ domain-containing adapter for CUL3-mediated RhoA degradation protein